MRAIRTWLAIPALLIVAACATRSPEAIYLSAYNTIEGSTKTAAVLLERDVISLENAEQVRTLAITGKATADSGFEQLTRCRAAQEAAKAAGQPVGECTTAAAAISLGSNVLFELEQYLKTIQKAQGVK